MKFLFLILTLFSTSLLAYVPTVESLFRNGGNPDVTANGLTLTMQVKKLSSGESEESSSDDFYKIFFTKSGIDNLKIAQSRYKDATFSESSLSHRIYFSNFSPYTMKSSPEQIQKGLMFAMLHSMTLNNGSHMVNYLKSIGVPVKLNNEIINRNKVEKLTEYKKYLVATNANRALKKTEVSPLRPEDPAERDRVEKLMNESMYVDMGQVRLGRDEGVMSWIVTAAPFEAVFSYRERFIQKIKYKGPAGEFEVVAKNYWLANGTHSLPKVLMVKNFAGEMFEVDITNLRQYVEKEDDIQTRLRKWDSILKGKESREPRPEFLL